MPEETPYFKGETDIEMERKAQLERERRLIKKDAKKTAKAIVNNKSTASSGKMDGINQSKSISSKIIKKGEEGKIFRKEVRKQIMKEVPKKVVKKVAKQAIKATANFIVSTAPIWLPIVLIIMICMLCFFALYYYVCGGGFIASIIGRITGLGSLCSL